jgi:hypothetical protein
MLNPSAAQDVREQPLDIVGGTHFGRFSKINATETWNFIVSDDWLVPYAGYKNALTLTPELAGRGIYSSFRGNLMICVIGASVYKINLSLFSGGELESRLLGNLYTDVGDVYIAENNNGDICITDGIYVYVYNYLVEFPEVIRSSNASSPGSFTFGSSGSSPGYISFHNGQLIIADQLTTNWYLSDFNNAQSWPTTSAFVGSIQTKPDLCQAVVPIPGGGNNILVFGRNATELWQSIGGSLFPYQRNSTFNIDYGCLNPATVAHLNRFTVWIGVNEQSGPVLMRADGTTVEQISTDGIDYQLGNLTNPENCTGFLYQQDGHTIYQFTFPDDNISYAYDFESKLFFNVSDENLNYHIAREIVYFNNTYYFVALAGGNIYEFDTLFTAAQYSQNDLSDVRIIPRIRICSPIRTPDQRYYIAKSLGFTVENGQPNVPYNVTQNVSANVDLSAENGFLISCENGDMITTEQINNSAATIYTYYPEQVNLAVSRDGGMTYGTFWTKDMNPTGKFKSRFIYQRLGIANDSTYQIRFNGYGRFTATQGVVELYR